jgi:MtrB/PioB family decaheme-associated outer membrane protein
MRRYEWLVTFVLVLMLQRAAPAQTPPPGQQPPPTPTTPAAPLSPRVGSVDFGVRVNSRSGDPARFQEFRDLRNGATLNRLRYTRDRETWVFSAAADNVGYRDQRYAAQFDRFGTLRASFEWNQIPWFHSVDTRTPWTQESEGVFRLPDALQASLQGQAASVPLVMQIARQFDTRIRRDIADVRLQYTTGANTDWRVNVRSTRRSGEQPWGAGFAFALATEQPLPIDQRTNEINTGVEWANDRAMARLAYDGSFYNNDVQSIVWDNPLRLVDIANDSSQGRMAIFPSSTAHTVSGMGSIRLPGRSRAHAYLSVGSWNQDEPLLPHTINTAIPSPPLSRTTAEAEARILSANIGFNTRPIASLWLNARYRLYDFDNRTPPFAQPFYVRADVGLSESALGTSEPFEYSRNFLDLDASYTPLTFVGFRVGYGLEHDDRTYRFLEQTTEHVLRASVDSTGFSWFSVRAQYEYSQRTGDGFDEQALSAVNEQVSLRQFDISDRKRNRLSTILQVMPTAQLGLTATVGLGTDDRPDTVFGLLDNDHHFYTIAVDYAVTDAVQLGGSYGRENYTTSQKSRQANPGPQFEDPTRDWFTDMDEDADTVTANIDLPLVAPRTSVRLAYDYTGSRSRYLYILPPNSTLATPEQLPPVRNRMHRSQADLVYDLTDQVGLGLSYWFDSYRVEDFAQEPEILEPLAFPGSGVFMGYLLRPYTAHTGWLRLIYRW